MSSFDDLIPQNTASTDPFADLTTAQKPVVTEKPSLGMEALRQLGLTARAGITGVASIPAMMAEPVAAAVGLPNQAEALQGFLTKIGLPEPQGTLERAVQTGAGAMAGTGAQAAAAKGIPLLAGFTENLPKQIAASGAGGSVSQAVTDEVTGATKDPYAGLAAGLLSGAVAGTLAGKTADTGKMLKGWMTGTAKPTLTMDEIHTRAQQAYRTMEDQNVYVNKNSLTNKLFTNIENRLSDENFNPSVVDSHKPVAQVLAQFKEMAKDPFISFTKLEQMRSSINELKNSGDAATRRLAGAAVSEFDNYLGSIGNKDVISIGGDTGKALASVKAARGDWRNLSRAQTIEDALKYADVSADKPTASTSELVRNGMINLARDKNKMRAFSETEQNAIRAVARGGSFDTLLTVLGKFNPERSQGIAYSGIMGVSAGPTTGAAIAGGLMTGGFAADKAQGFLRNRAGQQLVNQIASGTLQPIPQNMSWRGMLSGLQPLPGETQ
jgi:hypothetical protein